MASRSEMRINKWAARMKEVAGSLIFRDRTQLRKTNIPIVYYASIWSILIFFVSCGAPNMSDADKQDNYLFATIGTKKLIFSGKPYAKLSVDKKRLEIGGMIGSNNSVSDGLEITLNSQDSISTGSYQLPRIRGLAATYALQNISEGTVMGTTLYEASPDHRSHPVIADQFSLTIVAITQTRISGIFKGYLHLIRGTQTLKVENGSFSLSFTQATH
jgi:hypothetical protein